MGMFEVTFKAAKGAFFDRVKVQNAMDRVTRQALGRAGGYLRKVARSSMHPATGASPPGSPPHSHGLQLMRRLLFYSYDAATRSVVVGPALLLRGTGAPKFTEYGGTHQIWSKVGGKLVRVPARYPPRPFMRPAMEATLSRLPPEWKDRLR